MTNLLLHNLIALNKNGRALWNCQCDCGKETIALGKELRNGHKRSCGCLHNGNPTHGLSKTRIYGVFCAAKRRCENKNTKDWPDYGGRGVEFRLGTFEEFYGAMGASWFKGASIGRIDNNGHYEYKNIRWETPRQQANNTRNNVSYTYNGETFNQAEWARKIGITPEGLLKRVNKWGIKEALSRPRKVLLENRPHR